MSTTNNHNGSISASVPMDVGVTSAMDVSIAALRGDGMAATIKCNDEDEKKQLTAGSALSQPLQLVSPIATELAELKPLLGVYSSHSNYLPAYYGLYDNGRPSI